jgi:hypothetical protein
MHLEKMKLFVFEYLVQTMDNLVRWFIIGGERKWRRRKNKTERIKKIAQQKRERARVREGEKKPRENIVFV